MYVRNVAELFEVMRLQKTSLWNILFVAVAAAVGSTEHFVWHAPTQSHTAHTHTLQSFVAFPTRTYTTTRTRQSCFTFALLAPGTFSNNPPLRVFPPQVAFRSICLRSVERFGRVLLDCQHSASVLHLRGQVSQVLHKFTL